MTGKWDGDDSDESPNYRNPRGVLLDYMEYIVIYDFMYILLDSPTPLETSSDEASKRPIRNKSFGSRSSSSLSSSSLSSDDVDFNNTQPSSARNPSTGSSRKVPPPIPRPTRGNAPSNKRNRPPSPKALGSKENPIDVEKVSSLFEPIVIREYVWHLLFNLLMLKIPCR